MKKQSAISGYRYDSSRKSGYATFAAAMHSEDGSTPAAGQSCAHPYLVPALRSEVVRVRSALGTSNARLFDVGCGNGSVEARLANMGWEIELGSAYDDLVASYGRFPLVISLEVVEHVYAPRDYARTLFDLVEPGGTAIMSTPYPGYLKNLALAVTGKKDRHFTALWDHGHIKFWSIPTLSTLLTEAGFDSVRFRRVGRVPALAKSMIAIAHMKAS